MADTENDIANLIKGVEGVEGAKERWINVFRKIIVISRRSRKRKSVKLKREKKIKLREA